MNITNVTKPPFKRVFILGSTGMLGAAMEHVFTRRTNTYANSVVAFTKNELDANWPVSTITNKLSLFDLRENDYIINCIGVLKPEIPKCSPQEVYNANTVLPYILGRLAETTDCNVIHFGSDCVYSGDKGPYSEKDIPDADDIYARSKMIIPSNITTITTSIIGPEYKHSRHLVSWVLNSNKPIPGYVNCLWNGVTSWWLAHYVADICTSGKIWKGNQHIYSNPVTKYELIKMIASEYKKDVVVVPTHGKEISGSIINGKLDRTLTSLHPRVDAPDLQTQISKMAKYFGERL